VVNGFSSDRGYPVATCFDQRPSAQICGDCFAVALLFQSSLLAMLAILAIFFG
jgi:hypothetical protein